MLKKMSVFVTLLGLLAMSGVALAAENDEGDTVFNYGYDAVSGVLVWNATSSEGPYDCTLENGALVATYTRVPNGVVLVDGLADDAGPVSFPARPDSDATESTIPYPGPSGECELNAGLVAGPNGQINHGMFMKLFNSMVGSVLDGGRGCLNRHIAQSDLGKGDQQVKVGDVETDGETVEPTEGSIEFETVLADCLKGKHDDDDQVNGQEKSALNRADKEKKNGPSSDKQRGKSDSAPGRNK